MAQLYVCCGISVLLFIGCIVFGITRKSVKSFVIAGTAGVGGAVFVLRFLEFFTPVQGNLTAKISNILLTIGKSIVHMLQTFSLDEEYDILIDEVLKTYQSIGVPETFLNIFTVYFTILNVLAPVMTLAFILTLLEELIAHIRAYMRPFRETFIFSELNERTVTLAEDIKQHKRHALLLFTDSYVNKEDEQQFELRERARKIGALCIKDDITTMRIHHNPYVPITFVLADMNEYENLRVAAWMSQGNKKINRFIFINVLVFCPRNDSNTAVQAAIQNRSNRNMRFIAVNDCIYPIHQLLFEHPLFARMEEPSAANERKKCTVLVVGCGYIGMECVKAVSWCGQLANTDLKIRVVSNDAEEKQKEFKKACPELFSTGLYDIAFKSLNVAGDEFLDYLRKEVPEACYIIVALGEDRRNIAISADLKRFYNRMHLTGGKAPQICFFVADDSMYSTFELNRMNEEKKVTEKEKEQSCLLVPFGNNKERFSMKSIFNSPIEKLAMAVHFIYWQQEVEIPKKFIDDAKKLFLSGVHFHYSGKNRHSSGRDMSKRYELMLFNRCFPHGRIFVHLFCEIVSFFRGRPFAHNNDLLIREDAVFSYYASPYSQESSRASGIHLRYKLYSVGFPAVGPIDEESLEGYDSFIWDEKNSIEISKLEHLRWDAFMRSIGFVSPSKEEFEAYAFRDGNTQTNNSLLLHPCLVDWDERLGKVLVDEDFELYEKKDPTFLQGRFWNELDALDRVTLIVWRIRKERTGKSSLFDYKLTDDIIIKNATTILRGAKKTEELI